MGGAAEAQSFTEPPAGNDVAAPEVEAEGEPSAAGGSWSSETAEGGGESDPGGESAGSRLAARLPRGKTSGDLTTMSDVVRTSHLSTRYR